MVISSAIKLVSTLPRRNDTTLFLSLPLAQETMKQFLLNFDKFTQWSIKEAVEGESIVGGVCYAMSMLDFFGIEGNVEGGGKIVSVPEVSGSINIIMEGIAETFGSSVIGILLDGICNDVIVGLKAIKYRGGTTIAVSDWGGVLPLIGKSAVKEGVVDLMADIDSLASILEYLMRDIYDMVNLNGITNYA